MNRMFAFSDRCPRCMVCAQLMNKNNTSKGCDRGDDDDRNNNNNNDNKNNNNNNLIITETQ